MQAGKLETDVARLEDTLAARERELGQLAENILEVCQERDALLEKLRALELVAREPGHVKGAPTGLLTFDSGCCEVSTSFLQALETAAQPGGRSPANLALPVLRPTLVLDGVLGTSTGFACAGSVKAENAGSSHSMLLDSQVSLDWLGDAGGPAPRSVLQARPVSPPSTRRLGFDLDRQGVQTALLSADQAGALQPQSFGSLAVSAGGKVTDTVHCCVLATSHCSLPC